MKVQKTRYFGVILIATSAITVLHAVGPDLDPTTSRIETLKECRSKLKNKEHNLLRETRVGSTEWNQAQQEKVAIAQQCADKTGLTLSSGLERASTPDIVKLVRRNKQPKSQ